MSRSRLSLILAVIAIATLMTLAATVLAAQPRLAVPILEDSPRLDETVTNLRPVLEWDDSQGGTAPRTYDLQVDISPSFHTANLIEMRGIPEGVYTTAIRLKNSLKDNAQYFWRVRAVDPSGAESGWGTEYGGVTARFFVNTAMNRKFEYLRAAVRNVSTSDGKGTDLIVDYDSLNQTYWEGAPDQPGHWVRFDLGEAKPISRIFLVSGMAGLKNRLPKSVEWSSPSNLDGRLASFVWQSSKDGTSWADIPGTEQKDSDAYKEIIDLEKPVTARYFRLEIKAWHGSSPRVYDVMLYQRGQPPIPQVPKGNYVLVISNRIGFRPDPDKVQTSLGKVVRGLGDQVAPPWKLKVLELPAHDFSVGVLNRMNPKPVAIFLTGSPNRYTQIPFFEFNGEFELIRTTQIPTYGSCAGCQMMAMAYGRTFVCPTGRSYGAASLKAIVDNDIPPIHILKIDPIFAGMNNPFYSQEGHTWMVREVPKGWEVLATSKDSKGFVCNEVTKAIGRPIYGCQFHAEIPVPFSGAKGVLMNFLAMAVEGAKKQGTWIGK